MILGWTCCRDQGELAAYARLRFGGELILQRAESAEGVLGVREEGN